MREKKEGEKDRGRRRKIKKEIEKKDRKRKFYIEEIKMEREGEIK